MRITYLIALFFCAGSIHANASVNVSNQAEIPKPTIYSETAESSIRLAFAGDVMLGRLVNGVIHERGPAYIWGDTLPLLTATDATLVNLECVIAQSGKPFRPERAFYFRAAPIAAKALTVAGIDYVSLSNNHAMDFQGSALLETIRHLDEQGIAHAGAGQDITAASQPAILKVKGKKLGVIAFADHFREYGAGSNSPGTNIIRVDSTEENFRLIEERIKSVKHLGADFIVFSIHWGPNMREAPTEEFIEFAHRVIDAGTDVFHGHSAHIFQGIELYKGKVILYDTGDLIDDYYVHPLLRNDQQLLFIVTISSDVIERIELVPLKIHNLQVNLAKDDDFTAIQRRIIKLSQRFGTTIDQQGDRLVVRIDRQ
ncbi:MAG: CapA family protein [Gammaproteobacteria bacterium]|nr:CapA family protein [Gammaproteobacteria bacterium]